MLCLCHWSWEITSELTVLVGNWLLNRCPSAKIDSFTNCLRDAPTLEILRRHLNMVVGNQL